MNFTGTLFMFLGAYGAYKTVLTAEHDLTEQRIAAILIFGVMFVVGAVVHVLRKESP